MDDKEAFWIHIYISAQLHCHRIILRKMYTITYKSRLTQKKLYKKTDAIFSIYGKNEIIPWHFFWILT